MSLDCICPNCGEDLAIDGKDHIPGCPYILSPEEERSLDGLLYAITDIELPSPDPQPEGSPVGAGSSVGPYDEFLEAMRKYSAEYYRVKSPNTPRESRAVKNAGERTEGKS